MSIGGDSNIASDIEAQLMRLDIGTTKAKTQGEKDMIMERQAELKRR
jgi:hypothetical protein